MKLFVYCLIAVAFGAVTCTSKHLKEMKLKVEEVLKDLNRLKKEQQDMGLMLNTPNDYKAGCSLSALGCFAKNVVHVQGPKILIRKIGKSLKSGFIVSAVTYNNTSKADKCQDCGLYLKNDTKEFLNELGSLLQKANSRLMARK